MSEISASLKKTIEDIKRLADGSIDDQIKARKLMREKICSWNKIKNGFDVSIIPEILSISIKFMESDNHVLQMDGANYIYVITFTPDKKVNTQLVIDSDAIPKLKILLSSTNPNVLFSALRVFVNIAYHFPEKILENEILPTIIQFLKSDNKLVSQYSAWIMENISDKSDERIAAIFEANGVEPLIKILESKNDAAIECALETLLNIVSCNAEFCQRVIHLDALKLVKELCDRLFAAKKPRRSNVKNDKSKQKEKKLVKMSIVKFIKNVTSYDEAEVDLIIKENFIPTILQQIKSGSTPDIKIESIKVIENVISVKHDLIPALVQDYDILSFFYSNLGKSNADLLISVLSALKNIIKMVDDKKNIRQKLQECGGATKLTNLFKNSNEEIRRLSTMINEFVFDIKPVQTAETSAGSNQQEPEVIELNSDGDDTPAVETPQSGQQRKRPTQSAGPLKRSKRFRFSFEQTDSSSDDNDDDSDHYNDVDDHPTSSSPAGAAPTESNRNDHSGRQSSSFGNDTVATDDGPSRFNPKAEPQPTPQNVDIPTTSASRQTPDLPVAASTNNETAQNEMKPSVAGRLGYRSKRASNNSHVKPEAASTNDGNIRNNQDERPSAFNSEAAATADENIRNGVNPTKYTPTDDDFSNLRSRPTSASAIAPALPIDSVSANDGTMPNDIPNQVTLPAAAAVTNDDIIRDETIKYWRPAEFLIDQYCGTLEIQFSRKHYSEFISKIEFTQISSTSKPDTIFQPIDQTGFGCLSLLLTGNEDSSSTIRMKINKKFIDDLMQSGNFDEEKITSVIAPPYLMKEEHLQTIAAWLKCRILVYSNGWKKYGSWDADDQMIPIFVLEKQEIDGKTEYCIVLTLKND